MVNWEDGSSYFWIFIEKKSRFCVPKSELFGIRTLSVSTSCSSSTLLTFVGQILGFISSIRLRDHPGHDLIVNRRNIVYFMPFQ